MQTSQTESLTHLPAIIIGQFLNAYSFWHSNFSIILQNIIIPEKIQTVYPNFHPKLKLMALRELSIQISGIMVGTLFRRENAVHTG